MQEILHGAGGVALIIFGVRFLRKGLDRLAGDRLDLWLARVTNGPLRAAVAGAAMGVAVPSSTSLSLLTVSFVREGRIALRSAIALMLGAFAGLTLPIYFVAFNIHKQAPVLALVGVACFQGSRRTYVRAFGQVVLGLSFLFFGVGVIGAAFSGIAAEPDFQTVFDVIASHPWLVAISAAVLTMLMQSSTASLSVLLALVLADERTANLRVGLAYVLGANIGLACTTLVAGWNRAEARRLGVAVLAWRAAGAAGVLLLLESAVAGLERVPGSVAWRLAASHTLFNVAVCVLSLPCAGLLASAVRRLIPDGDQTGEDEGPRFLNQQWPDDPAIALAQSKREIGVMAATVTRMLGEAWEALRTGDEGIVRRIRTRDDHVDRLDKDIKLFLTREVAVDLPPALERERARQLRFLSDLEMIGDVIDRNLADVAVKKMRTGVRFSDEGWKELRRFCDATRATLELAAAVFVAESDELARKLLLHKANIRDLEIELRARHFDRLRSGQRDTLETTDLHLETLSQLKHINHVVSGVAYSVLGQTLDAEPARAGA